MKPDRLQTHLKSLHFATDVPDHPRLRHVETYLLPALGLGVLRVYQPDDSPGASRIYID